MRFVKRLPGSASVAACLLAEMGVELGQHEEEHAGPPGALGRRGAVREPRSSRSIMFGQRRHLLVGRADAEQHRGQLLLGDVAVEQVGDLAAQEGLLERVLVLVRNCGRAASGWRERAPGKSSRSVCSKNGQRLLAMTMRSSAVSAVITGRGSCDRRARRGCGSRAWLRPSRPSPASVATSMMLFSRGISASIGQNASAGVAQPRQRREPAVRQR